MIITVKLGITNLQVNNIVQVRLFDGTNGSTGDASITILDEINPEEAEITGQSSYEITSGTTTEIKMTVNHIDNQSGVDIEKSKWILNESEEKLETTNSEWNNAQTFSNNGQEISKTVTGGTTYYLHVLTVDKAGNSSEAVSGAISVVQKVISVTVSPSSGTIKIGETLNIQATITPNTANNQTLEWESSDTSIVQIISQSRKHGNSNRNCRGVSKNHMFIK